MTSQRANRQGVVFKRCTGCGRKFTDSPCAKCGSTRYSWAFKLDVHPRRAQRRQITRSGFVKERDAIAEMNKLKREQEKGVFRETVDGAVADWLTEWVETAQMAESTRDGYRGHIHNHIIPEFGEYQLQDLTSTQVKNFYQTLRGALSERSIHRVHTTLHKGLEAAKLERLIMFNPADGMHTEPSDTEEMKVWTSDELARFLASVRDDRWFPLWRTSCMTGVRRGELVALKWSDLDLKRGTLNIRRNRIRTRQGIIVKPPKTKRARRSIDLDQTTLDALVEWQAQVWTEQAELGDAYSNGEGWMWTWEDGRPIDPSGVSRSFARLVDRTPVPKIRLHDVRHTHATLLLLEGVQPHVVSRRLGHTKEAFTLEKYAHVLPGQQRDAAEKIASLIDG